MKKNPKVSVIIPAYNEEKILRHCLNSILNQNYENYEVIVVNNNSTDKTKEIINEFKEKNKKIRYLFESKKGRGAARHKGEINSKGKIILMTDADCIVPSNWIKEMIKPIADKKYDAVQGKIKSFVINYWARNIQEEKKELIKKMMANKDFNWLRTGSFAIKKSVLKNVGYINPNLIYCEDKELMIRMKLKDHSIFLSDVEVFHDYPKSSWELFKKNFRYGQWDIKIKKIHKNKKEILEKESLKDHLEFVKGLLGELLTFNNNLAYDFVSGTAWRLGLFVGWLKN